MFEHVTLLEFMKSSIGRNVAITDEELAGVADELEKAVAIVVRVSPTTDRQALARSLARPFIEAVNGPTLRG